METPMIFEPGEYLRIIFRTSNPLIGAILMSNNTTSGRLSRASSMARSPSPHSATTSKFSFFPNKKLHVSRINVWSSTIIIETFFITLVYFLKQKSQTLLNDEHFNQTNLLRGWVGLAI